jgi:hypothetical protein
MRGLRALGFATAAVLGLSGLTAASAQAASKKVTVTVVGIDRNGSQVSVQSSVVPLRGNAEPSVGPKYSLVPGTYFVGASVPTMANGNPASDTIVIRRVKVAASETIRLDARGGKLVSVWLNGKDLGSPGIAGGCIRGGFGVVYPESGGPQLYVKPVRASGVGFDWAASVPGPGTSSYDLAGGSNTGLPSSPVYRVKSSQLSTTVIETKSGPVPDSAATWSTSSTDSDGCSLPGATRSAKLPFRVTDYRTPGKWGTEVDTNSGQFSYACSMTWANQRYLAGRRYTVVFDSAVHGPSEAVPVVTGKLLSFNPSPGYQFEDPVQHGHEYCNSVTVSLSRAGHTVKTRRFTGYAGPVQAFSAGVHPGWYVLRVSSRQAQPHRANPATLLSPRTSLTWRFKIGSGPVPVTVLSFLPRGLNIDNAAPPHSLTTVRTWSTQNNYVFPPGPRSEARRFTVGVSYNDGKTWHEVRVVRHKGYLTFAVRNPGSGYVSLRATTVNKLGDTSVQTIYRAYRIR